MKVSLRSVGGVTGPVGAVTRTVDVSSLPPEERAKSRALLDAAAPFEQPPRLLSKAPHPWDFRYTLTVEDGARSHQIELHLAAAPPALRALVEWVEERPPDQARPPAK